MHGDPRGTRFSRWQRDLKVKIRDIFKWGDKVRRDMNQEMQIYRRVEDVVDCTFNGPTIKS